MQQSSAGAMTAPFLLNDAAAIRDLGPVTLIGQSHVACVAAALADAPDTIRVIELWKIANPLLMNELPALQAAHDSFKGVVISILGGSRFEALAMYRHPRAYDFVSPLEPDAPFDQNAELIPYDAIRAAVSDMIAHNLSLIDALKGLSGGPVLQVASPPVWGDERKVSDWDPGFIQPTDQFGSRYLRRKVYRVHSDIVRRFCADRGIEVIDPPAQAVDGEGFLKREFCSDLVHGNLAYGQLLAEKILRRVAELRGSRGATADPHY
jgi:hypothetical protein